MIKILRVILVFFVTTNLLYPCTTAIVSGKCTKDGRPILWKHRDTSTEDNKIMYFNDGKYPYVGLVDSRDKTGENVWAGYNSTGFAIMNSASYNLIAEDTIKLVDQEGILMKEALKVCKTVDDFEKFLQKHKKPLGVQANFGVIDAQGGAAYFETDQFNYVKIDVNDSKIAPFGYVIRTNYSFTGDPETGFGYIRYNTANNLFAQAVAENKLTPEFIFTEGSRCLTNSLTGINLYEYKPVTSFTAFTDFIPRSSSVASIVIAGVRKGEDVNLTTLWAIVGFPLTSMVVPVWLEAGDQLPKQLLANETGKAPICEKANVLKAKCYPIKRGSGENYIKIDELVNNSDTGILQIIKRGEKEIINQTNKLISKWRLNGFDKLEALNHYKWIDDYIDKYYLNNF